MVDAYQPIGLTHLAVDSVFMLPHLGALASINKEASTKIFLNDCLVKLGTCITPTYETKKSKEILEVIIDGKKTIVNSGDFLNLPIYHEAEVEIMPMSKKVDAGAGFGEKLSGRTLGGPAGIIIDARGRPLNI